MINSNSPQTAVSVLCDAAILAAGRILAERGFDMSRLDHAALAAALRTAMHARIESIIADWRQGLDAGLSESWLRQMVNAQAIEVALVAVRDDLGWIE